MKKERYNSNAIINIGDKVIISFSINGNTYTIEPTTFSPIENVLFGKVTKHDEDTMEVIKDVYNFHKVYGEKYGRIASLKSEGDFLLGKMGDKDVLGFFMHGVFELYDKNAFMSKTNEYAKEIRDRTLKLQYKLRRSLSKLI